MLLQKIKKYVKKVIKYVAYHKLRVQTPSIISNNCAAAFLYKEIGCKYLSPTINLQISPSDFIKFPKNLSHYLSIAPKKIDFPDPSPFIALGGGSNIDSPVGALDDLTIYFQHYTNFKTAAEKWEQRKTRINSNRLFFILIDTFCKKETVKDFFTIPYKNKLFITGNKDLLINENCIFIDTSKKPWFEVDWLEKINLKKWFLGGS